MSDELNWKGEPRQRSPGAGGSRPGAGRHEKPAKEKAVRVTVTLPPATLERLDHMAALAGVNRSEMVTRLIDMMDNQKGSDDD